jgi:hypothetical protein
MRGVTNQSALSIALAYHAAWNRRDYEAAWQLLDDDLSVDVPINSYPTKAAFVEAARYTREMATSVKAFAEFGADGEALLIYDMQLPVGGLRIAEYFAVADGRINRIIHVHDTAILRGASDYPAAASVAFPVNAGNLRDERNR